MKKINLEELLEITQKGARTRTITLKEANSAMRDLDTYLTKLGIKKKDKIGITAQIDINAQMFAKCYRGIPQSTQMTIKYIKKDGTPSIVSFSRNKCTTHKTTISLTDAAKDGVVNNVLHG